MDEEKKENKFDLWTNIMILLIIDALVSIGLLFYSFKGYAGFLYGWILGCGVEMVCLLTITFSSFAILVKANRNKGVALTIVFSTLRLLLIAGALILSAYYTYKLGRRDLLFFWTTVAGMLPLPFVLGITTLIARHTVNSERRRRRR